MAQLDFLSIVNDKRKKEYSYKPEDDQNMYANMIVEATWHVQVRW